MGKKTKIHYAEIDKANESFPYDEWHRTLCGLEEHEVEATDKIEFVTCKKCLRSFPKYKKGFENHINDYYE